MEQQYFVKMREQSIDFIHFHSYYINVLTNYIIFNDFVSHKYKFKLQNDITNYHFIVFKIYMLGYLPPDIAKPYLLHPKRTLKARHSF